MWNKVEDSLPEDFDLIIVKCPGYNQEGVLMIYYDHDKGFREDGENPDNRLHSYVTEWILWETADNIFKQIS